MITRAVGPMRTSVSKVCKFRDIKTLQKFASAHASIHSHFNHDRYLNRRRIFKRNRSAALIQCRSTRFIAHRPDQ